MHHDKLQILQVSESQLEGWKHYLNKRYPLSYLDESIYSDVSLNLSPYKSHGGLKFSSRCSCLFLCCFDQIKKCLEQWQLKLQASWITADPGSAQWYTTKLRSFPQDTDVKLIIVFSFILCEKHNDVCLCIFVCDCLQFVQVKNVFNELIQMYFIVNSWSFAPTVK